MVTVLDRFSWYQKICWFPSLLWMLIIKKLCILHLPAALLQHIRSCYNIFLFPAIWLLELPSAYKCLVGAKLVSYFLFFPSEQPHPSTISISWHKITNIKKISPLKVNTAKDRDRVAASYLDLGMSCAKPRRDGITVVVFVINQTYFTFATIFWCT